MNGEKESRRQEIHLKLFQLTSEACKFRRRQSRLGSIGLYVYSLTTHHYINPQSPRSSSLSEPALRVAPSGSPTYSGISLDPISSYIEDHGGNRKIRKILIANNGMAGTKAILSMRQWAYLELGDEKALEFVVMATPEDMAANAEFIRLADSVVEVPGGINRNNYANVDLIVSTAKRAGVDAVWPGWGHASENPSLPATLNSVGIKFIGPNALVMSALGDKVAANILAQTANVPSIPWSGDGLSANLTEQGTIPEETFQKACIHNVDEAVASANKIGYPVMVKASEGGGGKGIRMCNNEEELRTGYVQVQNEVVGSPIFIMQLCTGARHIEVQIIGDEWNNAVALNGRDCSTQRRFQKIFEEGPPAIVPPDTFKKMELAAQHLTQSIGYCGAGTVEFLYNAAEDKFYFLELNPRLQVEHPVTEGLSKANIPSVQLQVAMGIPLHRIPDIRSFYGVDREGDSVIDFFNTPYAPINTHVIAARITAENPDEGFKPTSGRIERVKFQSTPNVWGYFSVGANGGIHEYADSQFGHLFASGVNREAARKSLILALKEIEVRGEIRTTVEYLIELLETDAFKQNAIDTSWLDRLIREKTVGRHIESHTVVTSAVLYRAFTVCQEKVADYEAQLEKGQFGLVGLHAINTLSLPISYGGYTYSFQVTRKAQDVYQLSINGKCFDARAREQPDGSLLATFGGSAHVLVGMEEPLGLRMVVDGRTVLLPNVLDPSELRSDITGKIVRYLHEDGGDVKAGEAYVEVEAMKMIMALKSSSAGKIHHVMSPGSLINTGDLLANLQLHDPSQVKTVLPYTGELQVEAVPLILDDEAGVTAVLSNTLAGYDNDWQTAVSRLFNIYQGASKDLEGAILPLLRQYMEVESIFASAKGSSESAIADLTKSQKKGESKSSLIAIALAHQQLPMRTRLVCSLLNKLESIADNHGDWTPSNEMQNVLSEIVTLKEHAGLEPAYGEACSTAQVLISPLYMSPFAERVDTTRKELISATALAVATSESARSRVDILTALFDDKDMSVREKALEVYIRRAYRGHEVVDVSVQSGNSGPTDMFINWSFRYPATSLNQEAPPVRYGHMSVLSNIAALSPDTVDLLIDRLRTMSEGQSSTLDEPVNVLHIAFLQSPHLDDSVHLQNAIESVETLLRSKSRELKSVRARNVNVCFRKTPRQPFYLTFLECDNFAEDPLRRNMRPGFPYIFELKRIRENYELQRMRPIGRDSHVYLGIEKRMRGSPQTIFLRDISHKDNFFAGNALENYMSSAMGELERTMLNPAVKPTASSRLFLHIIPEVGGDISQVSEWQRRLQSAISQFAKRLLRLRVDEIEIKFRVKTEKDGKKCLQPMRIIASSAMGQWLKGDAFLETLNPVTGETQAWEKISPDGEGTSPSQRVMQMSPYPNSNVVQMRRASARRVGSTYAYDFLGLFKVGLVEAWMEHFEQKKLVSKDFVPNMTPPDIFRSEELVMQEDGSLKVEKGRLVGSNNIGMLAWIVHMRTPEYPGGRQIVLVCNDITVQSGSFGIKEDEFFKAASEFARERGLPRVYISSNSGARIGLVEDLKPKFKVMWNDPTNPNLGFKYLYLEEADYKALPEGTMNATPRPGPNEGTIYAIDDIIGGKKVHGIGVENLRGSGMIAGETSRAYNDIFTLSYVTGRSVGIGAYLVRLGQRTIQMQNGPLILTGYSALNKLLGRDVYTSQDQLGGPRVMYPNGVSHLIVDDDQMGVQEILYWLSHVPKVAGAPPSLLPPTDPVNRKVDFVPTKSPYDPRIMNQGHQELANGSWRSGFFDRGSYKEYLAGWGKSVVVGRARLGGIPFGVINVETRLTEQRIPADPANPESREVVQQQAGQVWFPDSAYKTAQAINDFNGEGLPLMIFANWRGFSGGTRDMYGEVLKFGAQIVDALVAYEHPVFVYIPPNGELRGGAWVVVDPTINEDVMEMYADKQCRGGILEPPGICEVKFRLDDQLKKMHQLDPELQFLDGMLETTLSTDDLHSYKKGIKDREKAIQPMYLQIAHEFADLHDRAGRMKAKGVVRDVLEWKNSRRFFYWRTRRLLEEGEVRAYTCIVAQSQATFSSLLY